MRDPKSLSKQQLLEQLSVQTEQLSVQTEQLSVQTKEVAKRDDIIKQLEAKLDLSQREYLKLWQERFAAKSERYLADPDQLRMDFGDTDESADAAEGLEEALEEADLIPAHRRRKPRKKRDESLPAHLPRTEIIVEIPEADKACDRHGEKTLLPESTWDVREKLIYIPGKFEVEVRKYPKWVCQNEPACGVASAERPTGIVEGDRYDTSVATQILVHKYAYHNPLYRQQDMFAGTGWVPSRSTLLNILTQCYFIVEPLLADLKQQLQSDSIIACDDTGVTLLYPKMLPEFDRSDPKQQRLAEVFDDALEKNQPSINAKLWAYRGVSVKLNVFDFTVSRHRDGPELFFGKYSGTILELRQADAQPIWDAMRLELSSIADRTEQVVLPKSDLRKSLNYVDNHWVELTRYLTDPQLPIDNNECEQLMKHVAIGRKNWMFCGSVAGGERTAGFLTLVSSAHRNDLDVWAYVNDVLRRLLAGETNYEPLLPWNWAVAHPESVRVFRQTERRERTERKQLTRAARRTKQVRQQKLTKL